MLNCYYTIPMFYDDEDDNDPQTGDYNLGDEIGERIGEDDSSESTPL